MRAGSASRMETPLKVTIYHNLRCSKSRQALEILRNERLEPTIVEYLKNPPSAAQIECILGLLGMEPRDLMRKKEKEYGEMDLGNDALSRDALIQTLADNPILIERPIVVRGEKAVLGRPPESVREIL